MIEMLKADELAFAVRRGLVRSAVLMREPLSNRWMVHVNLRNGGVGALQMTASHKLKPKVRCFTNMDTAAAMLKDCGIQKFECIND